MSVNLTRSDTQRGSALFIMIMILVALSILTFMATNAGKTDARIGNAYTEQTRAFIQAEEMLARLRYAIEQIPLPEGIKNEGAADTGSSIVRPIWKTENLVQTDADIYQVKDGEPEFTNPQFAKKDSTSTDGWDDTKTLKCTDIATWMKNYPNIEALECGEVDSSGNITRQGVDPLGKTRTIIELVSRKQSKGDIDDIGDTFYYRITIRAQGGNTGEVLAQGLTGIQYN